MDDVVENLPSDSDLDNAAPEDQGWMQLPVVQTALRQQTARQRSRELQHHLRTLQRVSREFRDASHHNAVEPEVLAVVQQLVDRLDALLCDLGQESQWFRAIDAQD
jgi:hypothetical protein